MSESLNNERRRPARKYGVRYPWRHWFSLPAFVLSEGEDFVGKAYTMAQQVRNAAGPRRHNVKVAIAISPDQKRIIVRVLGRGRKSK
jgi:hypothetical protein